ncbi:MAG: COG4705 family protein [Terriglobales bacterium]
MQFSAQYHETKSAGITNEDLIKPEAEKLVYDEVADGARAVLSKVPEVTIAFWMVKILATTLGETGGDALSMTLQLGYAISTLIFLGIFIVTLGAQVASKRYHPVAYWAVVVATTTVGTTTSDYLDRTAGLGYVKSSIMLLCAVILVLLAWRFVTGRIEYEHIGTRRDELFYWVAILVSNTLGTALGDFMATTTGLGFERGALVFAGLIGLVAAAHFFTSIRDSVLFWAAYVLTRPLGATLGDTLTKSHRDGGLGLGRIDSSIAIAVAMVIGISVTHLRRRAQSPAEEELDAEAD